MFSIETAECNNPKCWTKTFTYASCEPPICPACGICARCGCPEDEHDADGTCPDYEEG